MFTLKDLISLDRKPAPYDQGDEFWNDPYISQQLLQTHLAPDTDLASYKPQTMQAICDHLPKHLRLKAGAALVDLGCGPGLYCAKFSEMGYRMTGVDRSANSLAYAKEHAPRARFLQASYLDPFGEVEYDAAVMISEDYGVLSLESRKTLLTNIHAALKPGGYFAFDVSSLRAFEHRTAHSAPNWYASENSLFRPHKHFVLEKPIAYSELSALCDLYAVFDAQLKIYRFWQTFFSPDTIRAELATCGFRTEAILSDLTGKGYADDSHTLGVIAVKA